MGSIFFPGQGVAVDYSRAMAACRVGAERGDVRCQMQVGTLYYEGRGVDVDYEQARAWIEKAAAQDCTDALNALGVLYSYGHGVTPSLRRARECWKRAIGLGDSTKAKDLHPLEAKEALQYFKQIIQMVTRQ